MTGGIVIGLEVHVELSTTSKAFCGCSTAFGAPPNTQVCPVCLGLPGALPVLNQQAIRFAVRAGLALNCRIAASSRFDRKNYFYPDLPKGYQISQYQYPLCEGGHIDISTDGGSKRVGIVRVHLEEDTGKLTHVQAGSLVDFNRCGVPLLEIVSQPDMSSPEEARAYLQELRTILQYLDISDLRMEQGSLRCDANVSLSGHDGKLGTLVEVKNMNSFRSVKLALEHEVARQRDVLEGGGRVVRETRHWDEGRQVTFSSRSKEQAHDYRYFPEPDLLPLRLAEEWIAEVGGELSELPPARRARLTSLGLPAYDAEVLTASRPLAEFFDRVYQLHPDAKMVSNWLMGDFSRCLNELRLELDASPVTAGSFARLLDMIASDRISGRIAKTVLEEMCRSGKEPEAIVAAEGLEQVSDESAILPLVREVIALNPGPVQDFQGGKDKALAFLIGQVMKRTGGKANPALLNELFRKELKEE